MCLLPFFQFVLVFFLFLISLLFTIILFTWYLFSYFFVLVFCTWYQLLFFRSSCIIFHLCTSFFPSSPPALYCIVFLSLYGLDHILYIFAIQLVFVHHYFHFIVKCFQFYNRFILFFILFFIFLRASSFPHYKMYVR